MNTLQSDRRNIGTIVRVFFRSLLINASWNYSKMQNIGFAYAIAPAQARAENKSAFLLRHTESFSTNVYMVGPIIASVLNREEACRGAESQYLKQSLAGPYAALGDPFFWGSLRPFCSILAVGIVAAVGCSSLSALIPALVAYNLVQGYMRTKGFAEAYRDGTGATDFLKRFAMPGTADRLRWLSIVLLAVTAGGWLSLSPCGTSTAGFKLIATLGGAALCLACFWLVRKRVPMPVILYGATILLFFAAW